MEPKEEVTVWIALTDASQAAGCMEALSFKGELRQLRHAARVVENSVNRASQKIVEPLDDSAPGDAAGGGVLFPCITGFAPPPGPNGADHRRIGLGLNYTSPTAGGSVKPAAMLVRRRPLSPFRARRGAEGGAGRRGRGRPDQAVGLYRQCYEEEEARTPACSRERWVSGAGRLVPRPVVDGGDAPQAGAPCGSGSRGG